MSSKKEHVLYLQLANHCHMMLLFGAVFFLFLQLFIVTKLNTHCLQSYGMRFFSRGRCYCEARRMVAGGCHIERMVEAAKIRIQPWINVRFYGSSTYWLVVWNMDFMTFHRLWIISTDEFSMIFQRGFGIPPNNINMACTYLINESEIEPYFNPY